MRTLTPAQACRLTTPAITTPVPLPRPERLQEATDAFSDDCPRVKAALESRFADVLALRDVPPLRDLDAGSWSLFIGIALALACGNPTPRREELASFTGHVTRSVLRHRTTLERVGVIATERERGHRRRYRIGASLLPLLRAVADAPRLLPREGAVVTSEVGAGCVPAGTFTACADEARGKGAS
jgi:hypothetical protein